MKKTEIDHDYNEEVYLKFNDDVREAVNQGIFKSGKEHFLTG